MEVRRSEPILVEEPTLRKPDQKIATFPSEYVADPLRKDGKANRKYHFF